MIDYIPFKIATALVWRYGIWNQDKRDNLKPWMQNNVKERVAFFGGDGVSGDLWYTSNFMSSNDVKGRPDVDSLEKVYEISNSMICLFENADDAMLFKLTWF